MRGVEREGVRSWRIRKNLQYDKGDGSDMHLTSYDTKQKDVSLQTRYIP